MKKIAIGIPTYAGLQPESQFDYMRMMYHFGRRMTDYDFSLVWRIKSEQFRARNAVVDTALRWGAHYILFMDDDHVFDWMDLPDHNGYDFLQKLLAHDVPIVGGIYDHRGGQCKPVVMMKVFEGEELKGFRYLTDDELVGGLQEVDVQGGGFMLINTDVFRAVKHPWFVPEQSIVDDEEHFGTDVQLCLRAQEAGLKVYTDSSITIGHVSSDRKVITKDNRMYYMAEQTEKDAVVVNHLLDKWIKRLNDDASEYLNMSYDEMLDEAQIYVINFSSKFPYQGSEEELAEYYISTCTTQLCRQIYFHNTAGKIQQDMTILTQFRSAFRGHGLDFGCGCAPIGFELAKRSHTMDFVDIDGASGYEFLKWRLVKHGIEAGFQVGGPYDFVLMLDAIEHIKEWESVLDNVIGRIKEDGLIVTNYFHNRDFANSEHISMNHTAVLNFLTDRAMYPVNDWVWIKKDNFMGGAKNGRNIRKNDQVRDQETRWEEAV